MHVRWSFAFIPGQPGLAPVAIPTPHSQPWIARQRPAVYICPLLPFWGPLTLQEGLVRREVKPVVLHPAGVCQLSFL